MRIECVLCGTVAGKYSRLSHTSEKYSIYKCSDCGLEYTAPIPSDNELIDFYKKYKDIRADKVIVEKNVQKNIDLIKKYTSINEQSFVLDFGCGNGEFVRLYGNNCYGVELLADKSNEKIKNSIDSFDIKKFDCITLFGVLEHLNNLHLTMLDIESHLEKNAYLVLSTVDAEGLIPYYYKPPEHLTYWTKKSFEVLAKNLNLEIIYYNNYTMIQHGNIYLERLLSRTPENLSKIVLDNVSQDFPKFVEVPTNEILVIMQKKG